MSRLRSGGLLILSVILALAVAGCASNGTGSGGSIFQSIFSADLSSREPRNPGDQTDGAVASAAGEGLVFLGAGTPGIDANQTTSSFEPGEFSLNFQNADIREVVQAILGNALQENYTIDPAVSGSVTISSARPVAKDDLIPILEIVLQSVGAALVRDGNVHRVVLETSAVSSGTDIGEARPGYGISILPLRYVSAQTLISLIDGFGTRPGMVRAETARNLLIVLGNSVDREAAIETALTFDADWMQDQSVAILPLRHAKPETIIPELERIFASEDGGIGANLAHFMPMSRLRAVLVVSPQRDVIERARIWVSRLDAENPDLNAKVHVYRVKYRDARMLAQLLNRVFSSSQGAAGELPTDQVEPGAAPATSEGFTEEMFEEFPAEGEQQVSEPILFEENGAGTQDELAAGGGTRIQADVSNNSLVIYADFEMRQEILAALAQIDVPQLQVAINVTMAEIRLTDELRYGIQYFLKSGSFGLGGDNGSIGLNTLAGNIARELPGFNFVLGSASSPDLIISAFDEITDVQVLSSPSLVVVENERARFQVGDQIPITTRTAESVIDPDAPLVSEFEYRDTGIILSVEPRVSEDGMVAMEIEQEISSVVGGTGVLTPTISNRKVESSISVVDGQTVLLGGLISETSSQERAGIPGLSRIRGLGALFGRRGREGARTELIILIRPSVIRDSQDAQHVAEELRSRMWSLGASQAR
jgi:general secretion pathway protein D